MPLRRLLSMPSVCSSPALPFRRLLSMPSVCSSPETIYVYQPANPTRQRREETPNPKPQQGEA
ncbi:hypothetical protein T484DRAFT_1947963 [Baffinella frigidus]|nr:hypothetical protein T484DRAFT_1947963 [Cryptophyta sp. CCMP2293]